MQCHLLILANNSIDCNNSIVAQKLSWKLKDYKNRLQTFDRHTMWKNSTVNVYTWVA